tara:strand:+ start:8833 stop:11490 length:2658 start_codon:yes stop_codon:yes gene_type:complete
MYKKLNKYQNGNGDSNVNQTDSLRNVDLVNKRLLDYIPQQYQGDINIDEDDPFYGTPNFLKGLSQDQIDMIVDNYDIMINPNPDPNNPILTDSLYFNPFTLELLDERNPFVDGAQLQLNPRNDSILNIYGDIIQDAYESGRFDKLYQDETLINPFAPMDNTNVNLSDADRIQQQLAPYAEMIMTGEPQTWGVDAAVEKNQANRNAKTITSYLWDGIKGLGKFVAKNPASLFLYENIESIINEEEPTYYQKNFLFPGVYDDEPKFDYLNYGSELRKAQDGEEDNPYKENIIYSGDDGMVYAFPGDEGYPIIDTRVGQNVDDEGYAVPQYLYSDTTGVDVINKYKDLLESSEFRVPAPGGPPPTPFVYEEEEPFFEPIDYASMAYEFATPGLVSSMVPYGVFKGTEAAVKGTHNYLMENDENYRQLNNSLDSNDAKTKSQGLNMLGQLFAGFNPRFDFEEGGSLANYGEEIQNLVTQQKNADIKNIYEGDDRFTISKMEREKKKTDKLFQEQQDYLYDESGFLNPNLDLSKAPLADEKYTLYNPYSEEMFYDPMNPTKLFTETEYGEYQDDMTTKRTMAALNQRAEMYPELFQKVTGFDPETQEITYAGDKLEGDLFSDANPDAAYLQYTTPEGEESGSFTGSLVSDAEGDITGPVYDPFDQYENDEGTYTFMEAEAKYGGIPEAQRAHGGPHTEEEWEQWKQERENYENNNMSNESVNSEFNYYDDIAPGSYDPSILDNMYFADQFEEKIEEDPDDEFEFADPNKPVMSVKDEERKPRDFNFKPFEALVTGLGAVNQILENRPEQNYNKQLAMNQFQADTRDSRGFYDVNTGILNPDRNVVERQAAYGGRTDQLRNRQYDDIDTTIELDEGTIQELIAAGAEIEIL